LTFGLTLAPRPWRTEEAPHSRHTWRSAHSRVMVVPDLENKQFGTMVNATCDGRVNFRGMWDHVGLSGDIRCTKSRTRVQSRSLTGKLWLLITSNGPQQSLRSIARASAEQSYQKEGRDREKYYVPHNADVPNIHVFQGHTDQPGKGKCCA
jgi:hypothetical protein